MGELNTTLHRLTLEQHLLAGIFLLGYGSALGSMFSPKGRLCAAGLALLAAAAFAARTHPWEHGVLLVGCAIGGVAVFIALAWALSRIGARHGVSVQPAHAGSEGPAKQPSDKWPGSAVQTARTVAQAARRRRRKTRTA